MNSGSAGYHATRSRVRAMHGFEEISEKNVRISLDQALRSLKAAHTEINLWPYDENLHPGGWMLWSNHSELMLCLSECMSIEINIAKACLHWLKNHAAADDVNTRSWKLIAHRLLFDLIDKGAREVKTELHDNETPNSQEFVNICTRSLYRHWRVVRIVQSSRLRGLYGPRIQQMEKLLKDQSNAQRYIFVAHASRDKHLVNDVLEKLIMTGNDALEAIRGLVDGYVEQPTDLTQIELAFNKLHERLDVLSLNTWIDSSRMIPGDAPDEKIAAVIEKARVLLVFFTPHYEDGWYMRNKEKPQMRQQFELRRDEGLRAIPVVLCQKTWKKYEAEFIEITGKDILTCPIDLGCFDSNAGPEELTASVVNGLSDHRLLKAITSGA